MSEQQHKDISGLSESFFPAPGFRAYQREAIEKTLEAFLIDDKDVVELQAPTGFGKSITLYTIAKAMDGDAFYATPLKSLQDQLVGDEFIGNDVVEIKGRSNYQCALPDADSTVDVAKCQRDSSFECDIKDRCPYYVQKAKAMASDVTVVNLSYLMAESFVPDHANNKFGDRRLLIIDECQSLEDWAMNFVGVTISKNVVPEMVWNNISLPKEKYGDNIDFLIEWIKEEVFPALEEAYNFYDRLPQKTEGQQKELEELSRFDDKIRRLLADVVENHWVSQFETEVVKNGSNRKKLLFKPIYVDRFLDSLVWDRADKVLLSSATIPQDGWLKEIGLGDKETLKINVPSTFPPENRPISLGHAVGKMTKGKRKDNMLDAVEKVKQISEHHAGEKGIIHARGYNYIEMFRRSALNNGHRDWFEDNVDIQDRYNREDSLDKWIRNGKQIFMSVNMAEGIDLDGDKARWQVLLKTLFPFMGDKRIQYRVNELNDWNWYNRKAAIQIEQAYGRAVRSDDDEAVFYILDSSASGLIERNKNLFHDWFLEAIEDMVV